jgi:hypothetical protein
MCRPLTFNRERADQTMRRFRNLIVQFPINLLFLFVAWVNDSIDFLISERCFLISRFIYQFFITAKIV